MYSTLAAIRVRRSAVLATAVLLIAMYCLTVLASPAKAAVHDSDHDGMPNRWERTHGLNPNKANANANPDHDGLVNLGEYTFGTDPLESDSDGDGIVDGDDDANDDGVADGVADGDEDGHDDGDLTGTIATFDATTGVLTLDTSGGGQVTGTVTDGTELEWDGDCDGDSEATTADLVAGTGVNELEFVDGSTDLESVALACAGGDEGL